MSEEKHLLCEIPVDNVLDPDEAARVIPMRDHLAQLTTGPEIQVKILRIAIRSAVQLQHDPNIRELAEAVWDSRNCHHFDHVPRTTVLRIMELLLSWSMDQWECEEISIVYAYYMYAKRLPTIDELEDFTLRMDEMHIDQAAYEEENRVTLYVDITGYRQQEDAETGEHKCGLCQSDIEKNKSVYRLPCGHVFHADDDDCLEGTVQCWFNKNVKCPMCRADIRTYMSLSSLPVLDLNVTPLDNTVSPASLTVGRTITGGHSDSEISSTSASARSL